MTATVTGSSTATRAPARARQPAARRGLAFPRASTTPGKVRLIQLGLGSARGLSRRLAEYR